MRLHFGHQTRILHWCTDQSITRALEEMDLTNLEMIVLPGGLPGATNLYDDERVINLLINFAAENKITAAICAAPMVLDKAGLLENRSFTMYPAEDLYKYLRDNKRPLADRVVTDGKVITLADGKATVANGPTLEAVIDTAEQGGQRMMCHGFRPLVDSGAAQAMPLFRTRQQDARRSGRATAQTRDGLCPQHLSCAYLAARVTVPAGDAWRSAVGVEALVELEGGEGG